MHNEDDDQEDDDATAKSVPRSLVETNKGALYHKYDPLVHQFITHIRRIQPSQPTIELAVKVPGQGKQMMKADRCNPLAKPHVQLYYYHSRTPYYHDHFSHWWDECFVEAVKHVCPWVEVNLVKSKQALDRILNLKNWWDECFVEAVKHVCPWVEVNLVKRKQALDRILNLKFSS